MLCLCRVNAVIDGVYTINPSRLPTFFGWLGWSFVLTCLLAKSPFVLLYPALPSIHPEYAGKLLVRAGHSKGEDMRPNVAVITVYA